MFDSGCLKRREVWLSLAVAAYGIRLNTVCSSAQLWLSSVGPVPKRMHHGNCNGPERLKEAELITVLMSSQDVEVTESGRVICRPALQNNNPV